MKLAEKIFKSYLEPGEEIIVIFHKHPIALFSDLTRIIFFGYLLPFFLYILFPDFVLLYVLWMIITFIRLVYLVSTWYHDSIILTSGSLLDVTWTGFFHRTASRIEYPMIAGVSYEIKGFIGTILNYGTISISKMGGSEPCTLPDAMNPQKAERMIMEHQERFISTQAMHDANTLKSLLTNIIRNHMKNDA